jgi:hypothetical protein
MVYYSAFYDTLGILITDYTEAGHLWRYLEVNDDGYGVIPFNCERWTYVGDL